MFRGDPTHRPTFEFAIPIVVVASPIVSFYMIGQSMSYNDYDPTYPTDTGAPGVYLRDFWMYAALLLGMQVALIVRGVYWRLVVRTIIPVVGLLIALALVCIVAPRPQDDGASRHAPASHSDHPVCYSGSNDCPGG